MSVSRQTFTVHTDTGGGTSAFVDSGPAFFGRISQIQYDPTTLQVGDTGALDTGADVIFTLEPAGIQILSVDNFGGAATVDASHLWLPRPPATDTGGADVAAWDAIVSAGEHIKVTVTDTEGGVGRSGTFRVWTEND